MTAKIKQHFWGLLDIWLRSQTLYNWQQQNHPCCLIASIISTNTTIRSTIITKCQIFKDLIICYPDRQCNWKFFFAFFVCPINTGKWDFNPLNHISFSGCFKSCQNWHPISKMMASSVNSYSHYLRFYIFYKDV